MEASNSEILDGLRLLVLLHFVVVFVELVVVVTVRVVNVVVNVVVVFSLLLEHL